MISISHASLGAVIGLSVGNPYLALPTALLSHFVLDALPHFGFDGLPIREYFSRRLTYFVIAFELLGWALLLMLIWGSAWQVFLCALLAVSPDFVWMYSFIFIEKLGKFKPSLTGRISTFHNQIQKFERPWGIVIDILFVSIMLVLISL